MAPIAAGDVIPDGTLSYLDENDQLQKVSVHSLAAGKKVVLFGVPGAFTPTCSGVKKSAQNSSKPKDELQWLKPPVRPVLANMFDGLKQFDFVMELEPIQRQGRFPLLISNMKHVPGFIEKAEELKSKGVDEILCISVNDPFVMKAWAQTYPENKDVKFLADGSAIYTAALNFELDLSEKGLGTRSRRFALLVDDLKVRVANVESGGEFTVSGADEIFKAL